MVQVSRSIKTSFIDMVTEGKPGSKLPKPAHKQFLGIKNIENSLSFRQISCNR